MTVTIQEYCTGAEDLQSRIDRIRTVLTSLEEAMISGDVDFGRAGYSFDDGQTKISTQFRGLNDLSNAHKYYMQVLDILERRCAGGRIYTGREMKLSR